MRGAQTGQFVIPANSRVPVMGQGQFIRCLEANGQFYVSVNNGPDLYFASGISFMVPGLEDYTEYALVNKTGAPVTVIMAWGFGEVTDNRLTATGNLFVINAPATVLKVDDDETQVQLVNIQNQQTNRSIKRAPLTSLENCTYASGSASGTIVAGGSNVNGVRVARGICQINGSGSTCSFTNGGNVFCTASNVSWPDGSCEDIFIPAGQALAAAITGTASYYIQYEVL